MTNPHDEAMAFVEIVENFIQTIKSDEATHTEKREAAIGALRMCIPIVEASIKELKPHPFVSQLLQVCLSELVRASGN